MNENNNNNNIELKEIDYEININQKEEEMYNIIVYPEEEDPDDNFIINLPKNISYSKNEFETKIKYELSLKYYEFTELSNLKLKQIYIENNGNKIPFNFPSENEKTPPPKQEQTYPTNFQKKKNIIIINHLMLILINIIKSKTRTKRKKIRQNLQIIIKGVIVGILPGWKNRKKK